MLRKKIMKALMTSCLCIAVLVPSMAFADNSLENPEGMRQNKGFIGKRIERFKENREERKVNWEEKQEKREERKEKFLEVVKTYAPDTLNNWEEKLDEHKGIHDQIREIKMQLRQEKKGTIKEDLEKMRNEIKEKIEAGEITKEEAKNELKAYIESVKEERKGIVQEKKEELADEIQAQKERREEVKELRKTLRDAIKNQDAEKITDVLDQLYDHLVKHIEFDYKKLEAFKKIEL